MISQKHHSDVIAYCLNMCPRHYYNAKMASKIKLEFRNESPLHPTNLIPKNYFGKESTLKILIFFS